MLKPYVFVLCWGFMASQTVQPSKTVALFNGKDLTDWQVTQFGPSGAVKVEDGAIILGMGDGATGVTFGGEVATQNYEISLKARRLDGNDFFCGLTFPVNDRHLTLVVGGWGGSLVGLSCLDGFDASENETTRIKSFERNRWYGVSVRVLKDVITVRVDDETLIDVDISERELSLRPEVLLSRPLGIATWHTKAAIKEIKMTRLVE